MPTSVLYQSGAGLDYYIDNAGGYASYADKGRLSVHYANGSARVKKKRLFWRTSPKPGPGSTVLVPAKDPGDGVSIVQILGPLAQMVAAITTIVVVATR